MATSITTIQPTDLITNSRADINNNFDSLLVNKIETDTLTTDSTFTAASDSKIPSQLAVKQYVDAGGNVNATETTKGIVEIATQSEVDAGTETGATGASLVVNPSNLAFFAKGGFGDGSDGDVTISSPTTLTRDMYYDDLTVNDTLNTDGYKFYVKGTLSGSGTIANNNTSAGGNASGTTGGSAGSAKGSGTYKGRAGVTGGTGNSGVGGTGLSGTLGVNGTAGGKGGDGGNPAGAVAQGGTSVNYPKLASKFNTEYLVYQNGAGLTLHTLVSGGGGGAGGCGGSGCAVGGGGGSGGSGGVILFFAKTWGGSFTISATGATGGNGANATGGSNGAGGGGGGAGGTGGTVVAVYGVKTWSGSYTLTGGSGGTAGTGVNGGLTGAPGSTGTTGTYYEFSYNDLF